MPPIARPGAHDPRDIPGQVPHPARDPVPDQPRDPVPGRPVDPIPDRPVDPTAPPPLREPEGPGPHPEH
jgi:hypothetical protein